MADIIGSIWWMLVVLGLLVTFHEFGHYWVARRLGVKVLRFSVGFGRAIWKRIGKDGTEYVVAIIPLGGYVKMLDERDGPVPESQLHQSFNRKPLSHRFAIVAAGPVFNLVFAVFAFWLMFMVGIPDVRPVVGEVSGLAAEAGIHTGDMLIDVAGHETHTWTHARLALITRALDRKDTEIIVLDEQNNRITKQLSLSKLGEDFREENTLAEIGIKPWRPIQPAIVNTVEPDSPADLAGLASGDEILQIAGQDVPDWAWLGRLIGEHGEAGVPLPVLIKRQGIESTLMVSPREVASGRFSKRLIFGISAEPLDAEQQAILERTFVTLRYGPLESISQAVSETWRLGSASLGLLRRMLTGKASMKNLSGPISIAQMANESAKMGLTPFLFLLGLISLSLGILNLLPIPVLDGGHLMYYVIEFFKGSPLSDRAQIAGQYIGLVSLAMLMSVAIVNDILRQFG